MYLKNKEINKRYSIFPVVHQDLWERYKSAEKQTWVAEEPSLDKDDFDSLTKDEQLYLKNILAFFTISDGLVIDNLATNFAREVELLEAQYFYGHQTLIEQVHANGYSLLIEKYITDIKEKDELYNSMTTNPAVAKKAKWAEDWIHHPSFPKRLVAFACVEGISFSSVFAGVFYYRSRGLMPGLGDMNELIFRDETAHYEFASYLYKNYLKDEYKLSKEELREIIISCYEVERAFVLESMPSGLKGLTVEDMVRYVQFVTDTVLVDFGCEPEFKVSNPLAYMARIALKNKNNFFERRVGEYSKVELTSDVDDIFGDEF